MGDILIFNLKLAVYEQARATSYTEAAYWNEKVREAEEALRRALDRRPS